MKSVLYPVFAGISCLYSTSGSIFNIIETNAWQSLKDYPEYDEFPEAKVLQGRPSTAIGFSGGGVRSFAASLGQLAGLGALGLLGKRVRYIGGVSGGSWPIVIAIYCQHDRNLTEMFGEVVFPEQIALDSLGDISPNCTRKLLQQDIIAEAITRYQDNSYKSLSDSLAAAIQSLYLDPMGIPSDARFTWSAADVERIKSANPRLKSVQFLYPLNDTLPYPIIGSTIVGPLLSSPVGPTDHNYTRIEFTPLYVGQMHTQDVLYQAQFDFLTRTVRIGGAIEPYAFSRSWVWRGPPLGLSNDQSEGVIHGVINPTDPLDLRYVLAASSYAPGAILESYPFLSYSFGMQMGYWSPTERILPANYAMLFADGGSIENTPLLSFLQRRVQKSVIFFNSFRSISPLDKWNATVEPPIDDQVPEELAAYFGVFLPQREKDDWEKRSWDYRKNAVFNVSEYVPLVRALQEAQQTGKGIIATRNLTTIENPWWGIPSGFTSQITFVLLGRLSEWEARLSPEVRQLVVPQDPEDAADLSKNVQDGPFAGFPNYNLLMGKLTPEQTNLLADMTGWSILQNRELFEAILS